MRWLHWSLLDLIVAGASALPGARARSGRCPLMIWNENRLHRMEQNGASPR